MLIWLWCFQYYMKMIWSFSVFILSLLKERITKVEILVPSTSLWVKDLTVQFILVSVVFSTCNGIRFTKERMYFFFKHVNSTCCEVTWMIVQQEIILYLEHLVLLYISHLTFLHFLSAINISLRKFFYLKISCDYRNILKKQNNNNKNFRSALLWLGVNFFSPPMLRHVASPLSPLSIGLEFWEQGRQIDLWPGWLWTEPPH